MTSLIILGRRYNVKFYKRPFNEEHDWGDCDGDKAIIRVRISTVGNDTIDTLLHEIGHAIWFEANRGSPVSEENAVRCLATGYVKVLARNPKLLKYINQNIKSL